MLLRLTICLLICAAAALAQNDGRYRPDPRRVNVRTNVVRSGGNNDGRYVPSNSGRYGGSNDGRYVHVDNKYQHDNRPGGDYSGAAERYVGDKNKFGGAGGAGRGGSGAGAHGVGAHNAGAHASGNGRGGASSIKSRPVAVVDQRANLPQGRGTGVGKGGEAIIRQEAVVQSDGYNYLYETENGILAEESGRIEKQTEADALRSNGYYEYTGDDGLLYRVDYVADENGFVPVGAHIPQEPPHIAKLLDFLRSKGAL
ncbi:larval cuticle protein LCP-30 [Drosophila grimshawi]|uniref:GH20693 n=1 Tax=Drosophila grimshawi TaxID=7222 RepID=B4J725_DROGR|nr:larval cuticle protein LCP-30 [Drosophila grimshawi]EDW01013.1 GH20693 [Drosophila grimshawi]